MKRVLFLLAAVLYALSVRFENRTEQTGNGIFIALDGGITASEAVELAQREQEAAEPLGFCFYAISESVTLLCQETGQSAQAALIPVYGNGALLGAERLSWGRGCVMDSATAQTLFGTDQLGAQQVQVQDDTLPALGTVDAGTPTVLVSAEGDTPLDHCVIAGWDENGAQAVEQFLLRHGLTGKILNFYPLLTFAKNLTLLPLWALLILFCRTLGEKDRRLGWLAALAGLILLGSRVMVPKDMIPSMWSDFSFWGSWLRGQRENLLAIQLANLGEWTLKMEENMIKSSICALAGAILLAWAGRREAHAIASDRG